MKQYLTPPDITIQFYKNEGHANVEIENVTQNILYLFDKEIRIKNFEYRSFNHDDDENEIEIEKKDTISLSDFISRIEPILENDFLSFYFEFADSSGFVRYGGNHMRLAHPSEEWVFAFIEKLFGHYPEINTPDRKMLLLKQGKELIWCDDYENWCNLRNFWPNKMPGHFSKEQKVEFWQNNEMLFLSWISKFNPLNSSQIQKYREQLDWYLLSENQLIEWDGDTLEHCKKRICWSDFTTVHRLPLQGKQDEEFYKNYDWRTIGKLDTDHKTIVKSYFETYPDSKILYEPECISYYPKIPYAHICFGTRAKDMAPELVENMINLADETESEIEEQIISYIPREYLRAFWHRMKWDHLTVNINLPWDFALLFEFENLWQHSSFNYNSTAFEHTLKPDLNDEFIEEVMSGISESFEDILTACLEMEEKRDDPFEGAPF